VAEAIPGTELAARIDGLLGLVEAAATAADNANTVVGLTNKVSNLWRDDDPNAPATTIEKLSTTLDELATKLAAIDQRAKDLQERNVIGEIANQIASVQDGVKNISGSVDEAQTTVADLQIAVPRWIDTASIILTFLFIWMGVAQFALAAYGWRWFKVESTDKEEPALAAGPVLIDEGQKPESVDEEAAPESSTAVIDEGEKPSEEKSLDEMPEVDESDLRNEIKQYQDEAEKLIEARGRENYDAAAGNLKQAKDLYEELGQSGEWEAYISDFKARYSQLRALQDELEAVGL
jgi:hypothetical protein